MGENTRQNYTRQNKKKNPGRQQPCWGSLFCTNLTQPTGALDSATGHHIMDLFHKLHREQGKTIVLITHSRELAEETERIITLRDGRIVDDTGSNGEITNDRDVNDIREQGERKADTGKRGAIC